MADEVKMTPVAGAEPPKANPLGAAIRKPTVGGTSTVSLKPGLKLPPKPVIRKPGATVVAAPIPKPIAKPVEAEKPMETLKAVTQKLKGVTQAIPQQAILRKTGIIAEEAMSEAQKEAAKHKTARISLADAMGVAPVKEAAAPMKTIRIKRPTNVPGALATGAAPSPTMTQRKTMKISRPGAAPVRPTGKFGIKHPTQTVAEPAGTEGGEVADIPDIPSVAEMPSVAAPADNGSSAAWTVSMLVQLAACVAVCVLVWLLYQNSQLPTYCGGLGWGA